MHEETLEPLPGTLTVVCDPPGEVWVGTKRLGPTGAPLELVPGKHAVEVRRQDSRTHETTVLVEAGKARTIGPLTLAPDVGALVVSARVADGHPHPPRMAPIPTTIQLGDALPSTLAPLHRRNDVPTGAHALVVRAEGYAEARLEAEIAFGETAELRVPLVPTPRRRSELAVLHALETDRTELDPQTAVEEPLRHVAEAVLASVGSVLSGFTVTKLDRLAMLQYLEHVSAAWSCAAAVEGEFGAEVRTAVGELVDRELERGARQLVRGVEVTGLPPTTQARLRRQFLELVVLAKRKTNRVEKGGTLVEIVARYFQEPLYDPALHERVRGEPPEWEAVVPWIHDLFQHRRQQQEQGTSQ